MKKVTFLFWILFFMVFAQVLSGHELKNRSRLRRSRIRSSKVTQRIFCRERRVGEWTYSDLWWLTSGSEDNIGDLTELNIYPDAKVHPDYAIFRSSFDGWQFKPWDGWLQSIVTNGEYRFTCNHDSAGRLTEYFVENGCKVTITYNAKGNINTMDWYSIDDATSRWDYLEKMKFSYNANDQWTEVHTAWLDPATGDTLGQEKLSVSYDAQGNYIADIYSYLDETTGNYIPEVKLGYEYNANNQLIEVSAYEWDETSGTWVFCELWSTYSYDQNGNLHISNDFESDSTVYTYDANGNITEIVSFMWGEALIIWEPDYKETNTYNANGNLSSWSYYEWDIQNSAWVPFDKWTVSYHANGNLNEILMDVWDVDSNAFIKSDKEVCAYDAKDNPAKYVWYTYDDLSQDWEIDEEYSISFEYVNILKPNYFKQNGVGISYTTVNRIFSAVIDGRPLKNDKLQIYDLQGRIITELKPELSGDKTIYNWDYTGKTDERLANKVFLIAIRKGDVVVTQRIIPMFFR